MALRGREGPNSTTPSKIRPITDWLLALPKYLRAKTLRRLCPQRRLIADIAESYYFFDYFSRRALSCSFSLLFFTV
jgi:hypothetical protein